MGSSWPLVRSRGAVQYKSFDLGRLSPGAVCLVPQHNAARGNHDQIVAMLLEAGANAIAANGAGHLPSDVCEKNTALHTVLVRAAGRESSPAQ